MYIPAGITDDEFKTKMLEFRTREIEALEHEAREARKLSPWRKTATVLSVVVPIAGLLGLQAYIQLRRKRKK